MHRPNPLNPDLMSPAERRAELYHLLAGGLVRLLRADPASESVGKGDSSLHFRPERSGTAAPPQRRSA